MEDQPTDPSSDFSSDLEVDSTCLPVNPYSVTQFLPPIGHFQDYSLEENDSFLVRFFNKKFDIDADLNITYLTKI